MKKFPKLLLLIAVTIILSYGITPSTIIPVIAHAEETTEEAELTASDYIQRLIWYYANEYSVDVERTLGDFKLFSSENNTTDYDQWKLIMDFWQGVDSEDPDYYTESYDVNNNGANIPEGLPEDDSLCIVVLGYSLNDDGSMQDELKGRCDAAVQLAMEYPNAYIACTGGGTAKDAPDITEADSMKSYIIDNYGDEIDESRIIVENESRSTVENAQNTYEILCADYPEVDQLVMVTSQYHLKRGSVLYNTVIVLKAFETGNTLLDIVGTYGWYREDKTSEGLSMEAMGVAQIAGVSIGGGGGPGGPGGSSGDELSFDISIPDSLEAVIANTHLLYGEEVIVKQAIAHYCFNDEELNITRDVTDDVVVTYSPEVLGSQQAEISYTEGDVTVIEYIDIVINTIEGDLDLDWDVDRDDLVILRSYLREDASVYPECDLNGDGTITIKDARKLVTICTCSKCVCP